MSEFFSDLLSIATIVFAVSSMLSVGIRYTIQEIIGPLRNVRLLIGAILANFVLVPALAYVIIELVSIGEDREIGLLVVATAAGAPFLIKLAQMAGANVAIATGLLVLLLVITMGYMPLVVPLIAPDADVSAGSIAQPLLLTMLLPLVAGLVVDYLSDGWTNRLLPILGPLSTGALIVLVISTIIADFDQLMNVFGTGAILAALLFISGAFVIGYLLGMTGQGTREELGLATAQRNIAAATVVATQSIGEPDTIVMVIVTSVVAMAVLFPTAAMLRRSVLNRTTSTPSSRQATG